MLQNDSKGILHYAKHGFCLNTGNHRNHINSAVKTKRSAALTTRAVLVSFHKQHVCLIVSA